VRIIYIWLGGSAHHQTGVEEDVARWHVGLAFQVLDDCLDGKAARLLGGTGDGGEVDVGESGQPRVVVADDGDFTWHVDVGRPLPDSPRTVFDLATCGDFLMATDKFDRKEACRPGICAASIMVLGTAELILAALRS
jgi:hypothetical protein